MREKSYLPFLGEYLSLKSKNKNHLSASLEALEIEGDNLDISLSSEDSNNNHNFKSPLSSLKVSIAEDKPDLFDNSDFVEGKPTLKEVKTSLEDDEKINILFTTSPLYSIAEDEVNTSAEDNSSITFKI